MVQAMLGTVYPLCAAFEQYFPTAPVNPQAIHWADAFGHTLLFGTSELALCLILPFQMPFVVIQGGV